MKLLIGLGNPGGKYARTRHNIGFLVLEELAKRQGIEFREKTSFTCWCAEGMISDENVFLMKPQTFMNASGKAVRKVVQKKGFDPEDLLVMYDDADLPFGEIRFREGGGSGGHNGLQSILDIFPKGTSIPRLRIGIGRPTHPDIELDAWVLGKWSEKEEAALPEIIGQAADFVENQLS